MEFVLERLPAALHPLVAEAKRRARRRRGLILLAVATVVAAGSAAVALRPQLSSPSGLAGGPTKLEVGWQVRLGSFPVVAYGAGSVWAASDAPPPDVHGRLLRLDPRTGKTIATLPVGWWPSQIAVGAGSVWVADSIGDGSRLAHRLPYDSGPLPGLADAVSRIDPATDRVVATIHVRGIQSITAGGGSAWTTSTPRSSEGETISRIDPRDNGISALRTLPGATGPLVWGGGRLWALTAGVAHSHVWELDPKTGRVVSSLVLPSSSLATMTYRSGLLWVNDTGDNAAVFWIRTGRGLSLARRERVPYALDLASGGPNLWVAAGDESLRLLDAASGAVRARIPFRGPRSVGVETNLLAAAGRRAWIVVETATRTDMVSHLVSVRAR
jgi:hypothetical protein